MVKKKWWYIRTMKYYSAFRKNEVLIHVKTWMNLRNFMLSERSQMQNVTYCMIFYMTYSEEHNPYRQKAASWLQGDEIRKNGV